MKLPKGFVKEREEELVCKLYKSLYGLKQSGRVWHNTLKTEMQLLRFTPGVADSSVFFKYDKDKVIAIVDCYVDDGLPATN